MLSIKKFFKKIIFSRSVRDNITTIAQAATVDNDVEIGKHTYIGRRVVISRASVGRYCSVADNVSIGIGEHDLGRISTSAVFYGDEGYELLTSKSCIIKNDVWIGVDAVVRRGVTIGNGAVVGANSFVNADVPDFAIVAGNPARLIRYRFSEEQRRIITESHWWDYDVEEAKKIFAEITKNTLFASAL